MNKMTQSKECLWGIKKNSGTSKFTGRVLQKSSTQQKPVQCTQPASEMTCIGRAHGAPRTRTSYLAKSMQLSVRLVEELKYSLLAANTKSILLPYSTLNRACPLWCAPAGRLTEEALQCIICPARWIFSRRLEQRRLSVNIWEKKTPQLLIKKGGSVQQNEGSEIQRISSQNCIYPIPGVCTTQYMQ